MPEITLDFAEEAFRAFPNRETAARYLRTLLEYEQDEAIGIETVVAGVQDVIAWLDPRCVA